jgi:hypothetical protein
MLIRLRDGSQRRPEIHRQQTLVARCVADSPAVTGQLKSGQWRHGYFRMFRAGMMQRLGIVPQRLLGEPLRVCDKVLYNP